MPQANGPVEIGLLAYPGAQLAAIHGLTDLFAIAGRLAGARMPGAAGLRVSHWSHDPRAGRVVRIFDTHPDLPGDPAVVIAPPSLGEAFEAKEDANLTSWLIERHRAGATLASVCAGAFLLAETGLLAGRVATTHWSVAEAFAARFPRVRVEAEKLLIDDGDLLTAGGLMAWTDLGLRLVDRLLGPSVMLRTAQFLLIDPPGREQRYYSGFAPKTRHGDAAVLKVQHWLQKQAAERVSLGAMAAHAGLEERTFLRRFRAATGLKPTEYFQHVRAGKAREMLEFTNDPVDAIAWRVGYADPSAFRKVFLRITGLTPGAYRARFRVRPEASG